MFDALAFVWLVLVLGIFPPSAPFLCDLVLPSPSYASLSASVLAPSFPSPALLFSAVMPSLSFSSSCDTVRSFSFSLSFDSAFLFFVSGDLGRSLLLAAIASSIGSSSSPFVVVVSESIGTSMVHITSDWSDILDTRSELIGVFDRQFPVPGM